MLEFFEPVLNGYIVNLDKAKTFAFVFSGLYLGLVLVLAAIGILLTVLIILTYHKHGSPDPAAWYMKLTCFFARVICWYNTSYFPAYSFRVRFACNNNNINNNNNDDMTNNSNNNNDANVVTASVEEVYVLDKPKEAHKYSDTRKLNDNFNDITNDVTNDVTWKHVALVLDRFCFYVFFTTTVLMNVSSIAVLASGQK